MVKENTVPLAKQPRTQFFGDGQIIRRMADEDSCHAYRIATPQTFVTTDATPVQGATILLVSDQLACTKIGTK